LFFNDFDPLINYRREVLKNADEPFVFRLKGNFSLQNIGLYLAFLRIVEATTKENLKHDLNYFVNTAISLESEKKVFKKFELIFKSRLKNYDTKDEQDEKLMKSDFLTQNQKSSLLIRMSEKKVCFKLIEFAEVIQKVLEKKISVKEVLKTHDYKQYLKTIEVLGFK